MNRVNHSGRFRECLTFYRVSRGLEDADWLMLPVCLLSACVLAMLRCGSAVTSDR